MKMFLFVSAVVAMTSVSAFADQNAPEAIVDTAIAAVSARCAVSSGDLKLVDQESTQIPYDQGYGDDLYTLKFEVMNNTNDNDEDIVVVQVLKANFSNPLVENKPTVVSIESYGYTVCK